MMIDQAKLKAFLIEMLEQAEEVEAASGEIPSAQEAIGWIIDWVDDQSSKSKPPLDKPPA
jgi:hypothetical protein